MFLESRETSLSKVWWLKFTSDRLQLGNISIMTTTFLKFQTEMRFNRLSVLDCFKVFVQQDIKSLVILTANATLLSSVFTWVISYLLHTYKSNSQKDKVFSQSILLTFHVRRVQKRLTGGLIGDNFSKKGSLKQNFPKLTFLTSCHAHESIRVSKMLVFRKIWVRTKWMIPKVEKLQ